jgi:hypothetical protein
MQYEKRTKVDLDGYRQYSQASISAVDGSYNILTHPHEGSCAVDFPLPADPSWAQRITIEAVVSIGKGSISAAILSDQQEILIESRTFSAPVQNARIRMSAAKKLQASAHLLFRNESSEGESEFILHGVGIVTAADDDENEPETLAETPPIVPERVSAKAILLLPKMQPQPWVEKRPDGLFIPRQSHEHHAIYGPYIALPVGDYAVEISAEAPDAAASEEAVLHVEAVVALGVIKDSDFSGLSLANGPVKLTFSIAESAARADGIEIRLSHRKRADILVRSVDLRRLA